MAICCADCGAVVLLESGMSVALPLVVQRRDRQASADRFQNRRQITDFPLQYGNFRD